MNPRYPVSASVKLGEAKHRELIFFPNRTVDPFTLGTEGDWQVAAAGVEPRHGRLRFDGSHLFVSAESPNSRMLLDGVPVAKRWTAVELPAVLCVGRARVLLDQIALFDASALVGSARSDARANHDLTAHETESASEAHTVQVSSVQARAAAATAEKQHERGAFERTELSRNPESLLTRELSAPNGADSVQEEAVRSSTSTRLVVGEEDCIEGDEAGETDKTATQGPGFEGDEAERDDSDADPDTRVDAGPSQAEQETTAVDDMDSEPITKMLTEEELRGEGDAGESSEAPTKRTPPHEQLRALAQRTGKQVRRNWGNASLPKKLATLLMPFVVGLVAYTQIGPSGRHSTVQEGGAQTAQRSTEAGTVRSTGETEAGDDDRAIAAKSNADEAQQQENKKAPQSIRDAKLERRAIDAVIAGEYEKARELYERLHAGRPEERVFEEAARIVGDM